nr:hypothetical protein [uncultured Carboxylicivirga sp.]
MSFNENYEEWKELIEAVPDGEVKLPNQPIDDFAASCETLAIEAQRDKEALTGAGLDVKIIDEVTPLTGALRYIQANWMSEFRARQEAQKEWQQQSPEAYKLRDDMLHHFTFAYRKDSNLLQKVRRLREGSSNADMIQDLIELAVLGENNPQPLGTINFDMPVLQEAKKLSHSLSELLAQANGTAEEGGGNKLLRDKAYTLLYKKVQEIREYGRYVFWKNDERLKKYIKA